jgi:hypothetical protein
VNRIFIFILFLIRYFQDLYDEMAAATSAYCPPPTSHPSAYSSMHANSFFAAAAAAAAAVGNSATSIQHGISSSPYHGREDGE